MFISAARIRVAAAILGGVAVLGLAGCARPVTGTGTPAATPKSAVTSQAPPSVAPSTVYVTPPATVTVRQAPPKPRQALTPCQRMYAAGYSFDAAFSAWAEAGFPPNWDADNDGFPCEQSYGEQN
ncbi:MAG TPA: hypothetical protein VGP26_26570 [Actinophytocola sp.]|jgi:hypothetical protein|nr:hypothetical protein [Actinophytocola sp.]